MRAETSRFYEQSSGRRPLWLKAALMLVVFIILTAPRALAQPAEEPAPVVLPMPKPHMLLRTGDGELRGPDGRTYLLPQLSHVLNPDGWSELDAEMMRLQEVETRLKAENKSLRSSASDFPWLPVAIGTSLGIAAGVYLGVKYSK